MAIWHSLSRHLQPLLIRLEIPETQSFSLPIRRYVTPTDFLCQSNVTWQLGQERGQSAQAVAEVIAGYWEEVRQTQWQLQIMPSGVLQFQLTDAGIAGALSEILNLDLCTGCRLTPQPMALGRDLNWEQLLNQNRNTPPAWIFPVQYSHARCCSLLRLAQQEQLISLTASHLELTPPQWQFLHPQRIPWLTPGGNLQLVDPAERYLVCQLLFTFDLYEDSSVQPAPHWQKLAINLSDRFQVFYRRCRIWGERKDGVPELAWVRLGLVLATQKILALVLTEKLAVLAPSEL